MKPLRLEMQAFGPYADRQRIDFTALGTRSFFLIHGPTGAGKTTIFDAICYALYGTTSGAAREAKYMRSQYAGPDKETHVVLDFQVGNEYYRVMRSPEQELNRVRGEGTRLYPSKSELLKIDAAGNELKSLGDRHVTDEVVKIIGFEADQFRQVVLLPQGDFRKLLLAGSAEREKILATLFSTAVYARVAEKLREREQALRGEFDVNRQRRTDLLAQVEAADEQALSELITATAARVQNATAAVATATAKHNAAVAAAARGEALQKRFEALQDVIAKAKDLAARQASMAAREAYLGKLQKAAEMVDSDAVLQRTYENGNQLNKELAAMQATAQQKAVKDQFWATEETFIRNNEEAQTERTEQLTKLANWLAIREEYEQAVAAFTAAESKVAAAWQDVEKANQAQREREEALADWQKRVREWERTGAETGQWREQLRRADERLAQYHQWQEVNKQAAAVQAEVKKAQTAYDEARITTAKATRDKERLEYLRELHQAAVLAAGLEMGKPCPVCGSTEHPAPAHAADVIPTEAEWEAVQAMEERVMQKERDAEVRLARMSEQAESVAKDAADKGAALAGVTVLDLERERQRLADLLAKSEAAAKELAQAMEREKAWQEAVQQAKTDAENKRQAWEGAKVEAATATQRRDSAARQLPADLPSGEVLRRRYEEVAQAAADYRRRKLKYAEEGEAFRKQYRDLLKDIETKENRLAELRQEYKDQLEELKGRLTAAGFADRGEFAHAKADLPKREMFQRELDAYKAEVLRVEANRKEMEAELKEQVAPDMEALLAAQAAANAEMQRANTEQAAAAQHLRDLQEARRKYLALQEESGQLDEKYRTVGRLAGLANGSDTQAGRVTFQRYVLSSLLGDVVASANRRLEMMSHGRYRLQNKIEGTDRRSSAGLELAVLDYWTGDERPANTLSGGETFQASLALALGLADTAQAYAGGLRLDTVFVDEGFGTLDGDALNEAIRTLISLRDGGRLVGIISHVEELKERIDTRLEITKTERGSRAAWHFD